MAVRFFGAKKASRKLSERSYLFLLVRKLSVDDMKNLVDDIENTFANKMQTETTTSEIGDMVLMGLKKLDHVAYVRFASVYKDFSDVDSFIQIITDRTLFDSVLNAFYKLLSVKRLKRAVTLVYHKLWLFHHLISSETLSAFRTLTAATLFSLAWT